jgi:uncharacterized glyoxalase superfamily protein PhnB
MIANRSMPGAVIIPELAYDDVGAAVAWLCDRFGFEERLRIGNHRAQLLFGEGAVIVTKRLSGGPGRIESVHSVMVRVGDVDRHHARAVERDVRIIRPPENFPYGERQYVAEDFAGHIWIFSQTIADVDPSAWGGVLLKESVSNS